MGIVWLDSKTSETVPSFYISSHAKFLENFSLAYENKCFGKASVNGIYKHRTPQKSTAIDAAVDADCFVMNLKGEYFLFNRRLSLFGEIDNVFNKSYQDLLGSQLPGRWLIGGAKVLFEADSCRVVPVAGYWLPVTGNPLTTPSLTTAHFIRIIFQVVKMFRQLAVFCDGGPVDDIEPG